jgi:hypothetical protein
LEVEHTKHGECTSLDPVVVLAYAYSFFGIEPYAKVRWSPLAISIDTAMLLANHYSSLVGFKIQDPNAMNPWDRLPLKKMQSVNMIIPTCLLATKETKESFQTFQTFFEHTLALGKMILILICCSKMDTSHLNLLLIVICPWHSRVLWARVAIQRIHTMAVTCAL